MMPRNAGIAPDGRQANWFNYIWDFNSYEADTGRARDEDAFGAGATVSTAGGTSHTFTVRYYDQTGISTATLDNNDVEVQGPGDFVQAATLVSIGPEVATTAGTARTVTYRITAPGGTWDHIDAGTYRIVMRPGQVRDTAGHYVPDGEVGCFQVNISDPSMICVTQMLARRQATVAHTPIDIGPIASLFDGRVDTLIRTPDIDPAVVTLTFSEPQTFHGFRAYFSYASGDPAILWQVETADTLADLNGRTGSWRQAVPLTGTPVDQYSSVGLATPIAARLARLTATKLLGDDYVHLNEWQLIGPPICQTCPVIAWGDNWAGQTHVPSGLSNVVAIAAGAHSLALTAEGRVVGWGNNWAGQADIPSELSNVVAIAAGRHHSLVLTAEGRVIGWGWNVEGQTNVPSRLTNAVAIAAGGLHNLALTADGQVIGWGNNGWGQATIPRGLSNVVAVAAGGDHSLALTAGGRVIGWGSSNCDQTTIPSRLSNVVAIAAGALHSLALTAEGSVVGWGDNSYRQTTIPSGLSNVVAIAAGYDFSLALTAESRVVAWGNEVYGQLDMPPVLWTVVAIAAGDRSSLALVGDGSVTMTVPPASRSVCTGTTVTLNVMALGTPPLTYQRQFNGTNLPDATNASLVLPRVQPSDTGDYRVVVSNVLGAKASRPAVLTVADCPPGCPADSDEDGMPDGWEQDHGLDPFAPGDSIQDPDRDGMSNVEEYIAGTRPRDPQSVLRMNCTWTESRLYLTFRAVGGREYAVQYSDALGSSWQSLTEVPAATNAARWLSVSDLMSRPMRIYRVVIPRPAMPVGLSRFVD